MPRSHKIPNIHPGEILQEEFLNPLHITQYRLAKDLGVPQTRIAAVLKQQRSITPDTAVRLARYFNTTPQFWLNLQAEYDLEELERTKGKELKKIHPSSLVDLSSPM